MDKNEQGKQMKDLLTRDSSGNGVPDIVEDPDAVLDTLTLPNGTSPSPLQKKIIKTIIAGMGAERTTTFLKQVGATGIAVGQQIKDETSSMPASPSQSTQHSDVKRKTSDWIRAFLLVDAIIICGILYYFFGR